MLNIIDIITVDKSGIEIKHNIYCDESVSPEQIERYGKEFAKRRGETYKNFMYHITTNVFTSENIEAFTEELNHHAH